MTLTFGKTFHRKRLDELLTKHASRVSGNIIDIGSKDRRYDSLFSGAITAVDIVPDESRNVVYGDIEKGLSFPDASFDGALCIEVFQYLDNYEKAMAEIARVLKPGGSAIIALPLMYADHEDNIRFTERFISKKMSAVFSEVECFRIGNGFTVIGDILYKKIAGLKSRMLRYLARLLVLPYFLLLEIPAIKKNVDSFYSGLCVIVKK